jgi:muconolactone delta-isomerase
VAAADWQQVSSAQVEAFRSHYQQGKIRSIYREAGRGVLAIYDVADAQEMDQILLQMPMAPYFEDVAVQALWDMEPVIREVQ